jgi:hypothetical protein
LIGSLEVPQSGRCDQQPSLKSYLGLRATTFHRTLAPRSWKESAPEYLQSLFALETAFELILFGLVPLFLTLATVWILWHSLEKINPDEVTRHSGIRNHRVVGLVSNHRGGGCDRSESKGQKEPTYSVDLRFVLWVARLVQV